MKKGEKKKEFVTEYTVGNAVKKGDIFTRLSMIFLGLGNFARGEMVKGILFLTSEVGFLYLFVSFIMPSLGMLPSLGLTATEEVFNETTQLYEYTQGDNSMLILLYGVISIFMIAVFVVLWRAAQKSAYKAQYKTQNNIKIPSFMQEMKTYLNEELHKFLLTLPVIGIVAVTIMPIVYMVSMAFTNFDRDHQPPGNLFTWVGLDNFKQLFDFAGNFGSTFMHVLGWTLIWAVFATGLNYVFGMLLAMVINRKETHFKGFYRMCFVVTIAVPQFVSLLLISQMLQPEGIVNVVLRNIGILGSAESLPFLTNITWARVTVIIVNLWVGMPHTMLTTTGILNNIPPELYEAAEVDGANKFVTFFKITLPYMLHVTGPYLITTFVGNINNFNVIYLLTQGKPNTMDYYKMTAGKTDLLVTWLYKLTIDNRDYNLGAVIGIMVFAISAFFSLIVYRRTGSYKNEEGFQ